MGEVERFELEFSAFFSWPEIQWQNQPLREL